MGLRIDSYIQHQDYSLWEIIEEGNSFKPVAQTTREADGTSTTTIHGAVTIEEKILKKNDLKARSILMMTLPSHSSTNDDNIANVHVSTGSSPVSTNNSTACLSDATVYAYLATQPNGSQVVHEDLEQIHEDDLDEMDLKNPKSQGPGARSQGQLKETVIVEEASPKALLAVDGTGFDWSYMAEQEDSTNFALMAFFDFESVSLQRLRLMVLENSLDQMIGNQLVGNTVPPPLTGLFAPPSVDLSSSGIEKFKEPKFEGYGVKVTKSASENVSKEVKKTSDAPIIEDWVSDCDEDETVVLESLNVQKPKQADQPRKVSQNPRNNSTSWNTPKPKKLGVGFQFTPKACFVCGSFNHLIKDCDFHDKKMVQKPVLNNVKKVTGQREVRPVWTNAMRVNHQNFSNSKRNFAPKAVLTKSGLILV
ncbi:hypothetical protein Tco_0102795 [Tanacetum coccineum]